MDSSDRIVWSNRYHVDSPDKVDVITGYYPVQAHCHCGWDGPEHNHSLTHVAIRDLYRHGRTDCVDTANTRAANEDDTPFKAPHVISE